MKILITGASGFLGKNLINYLSSKHDICGFSRRKLEGIDYFQGDISNINDLEKAIYTKKTDAIIHLAGAIKGSKETFYTTNVIGAKNLSYLAAKYKIKKIVYVSSLAAFGPLEKQEPVSYYGYTKRVAEIELLKNAHVYNLTILRPPIIYGPNEQEVYKIIKFANITGLFLAIDNMRLSFIYVEDLVKVIEAALTEQTPKVYTVCENNFYDFFEVAKIIAHHLGKRLKVITIPKAFLQSVNLGFKISGIFFDKINEINAYSWVCKNNYPTTSFEIKNDLFSGMYKTIRWYRENGWL